MDPLTPSFPPTGPPAGVTVIVLDRSLFGTIAGGMAWRRDHGGVR